ncbi:MAG: hypothetical protein NXI22_13905 [bacterium]|nr:hypothetical protein [bacterium]
MRITSGYFENFEATIEDVDPAKNSAEVMVHIFGRVTPFWMSADELGVVE